MNFSNKIRLNFHPLSPKKFEFKVWRQVVSDGAAKSDNPNIFRYSLPETENREVRKDYWVCLDYKDSFEEFRCNHDFNNYLTKRYLFLLLQAKSSRILDNKEYFVNDRDKTRRINYILANHEEGQEIIWLEPYYLSPCNCFGFLVNFKFRKNKEVVLSRTILKYSLSLDDKFQSNRNFYIDRYNKILEFWRKFLFRIFPLNDPLNGTDFILVQSFEDIITNSLDTKQYVFAKEATGPSQYKGVEKYGPLEGIEEPVVFAYIVRPADESLARELAEALRGKAAGVLFTGMEKYFRIRTAKIVKINIEEFSEKCLSEALDKLDGLIPTDHSTRLIPILICDKTDEKTYIYMKYELLKRKLPLQVVTIQLLRNRESLKWSASNIALQIFSKLGGKAWKVNPKHENCVILGIGQAHHKTDGIVRKYFAYSVSTDSSGIYKKLSILGNSEDQGGYIGQMKANIAAVLKEYLDQGYKKYVIHIPFKISMHEIVSIKEGLQSESELKFPDVEITVIKINTENKYFGFAYTNSMVPYESTYLLLNRNPQSYLVWFEGLQYHRDTIFKLVPGPAHIEFYWTNRETSLSDEDFREYLQDILNLSGANWRGFNAKNMPISIYYCQLIAHFLKRFPTEPENLAEVFDPWFL